MSQVINFGELGGQSEGTHPQESAAAVDHRYVRDATDQNFQEFLDISAQVPVVVDLWATWCGPCKQLSPILESFASQYQGKFLLAKVDVDQNPGLQQAFQAQSIPAVFALIRGQVMPLFTGAIPAEQVQQVLEQLMTFAAEQGVIGSLAEENQPESEPEPEPLDENHQAAYDAINAGDYDQAIVAYTRAIENNPRDDEAIAGLAQVQLLKRLGTQQPSDMRAQAADQSDNIEAQMNVADLDIAGGHIEDAFLRLLEAFASADPNSREAIRLRMLDYFAIVGSEDPRVVQARQRLASLLY